jgi:hypothetical protein
MVLAALTNAGSRDRDAREIHRSISWPGAYLDASEPVIAMIALGDSGRG